jgi:hypothetical protein
MTKAKVKRLIKSKLHRPVDYHKQKHKCDICKASGMRKQQKKLLREKKINEKKIFGKKEAKVKISKGKIRKPYPFTPFTAV